MLTIATTIDLQSVDKTTPCPHDDAEVCGGYVSATAHCGGRFDPARCDVRVEERQTLHLELRGGKLFARIVPGDGDWTNATEFRILGDELPTFVDAVRAAGGTLPW